MLYRPIPALLFALSMMGTVCDAGVLSSDWGMSPKALRSTDTPELANKTMECFKFRCMLSAEYTMYDNRMQAEFSFSDGDKDSGKLQGVSLIKYFDPTLSEDPLSPKHKLFTRLVELYTDRYGEPKKSINGEAAKLHGVHTYSWFDSKRNNSIELEKWTGYINLDYAPIRIDKIEQSRNFKKANQESNL